MEPDAVGALGVAGGPGPAPMAQVRSDVGRISAFFHSIHSGYVRAGILVWAAAAATGVGVAVSVPLRDWPMHAAMYAVLFVFVMFYLRAHQLRRRVAKALYAVVGLGLILFFAWALLDLEAPRLTVVDGPIAGADGRVIVGPTAVMRAAAPLVVVPVALLGVLGAWLVFHWLVVARHHRSDDRRLL